VEARDQETGDWTKLSEEEAEEVKQDLERFFET
jgi:hypothetical protein